MKHILHRITMGRQRAASFLHPGGWRRDSEAAQTLVEFSLILPLFLLLIFALVDFGRAFYTWQIVTNSSREGARAAAVQSDLATVDSKIYGSFCTTGSPPSGCALDTAKFHRTVTNIQGARGSQTTVAITYDFSFVTPINGILNMIGASSLANPTISATTSMRLE